MRLLRVTLVLGLFAPVPLLARADPSSARVIEAASTIERILVHPDAATVTRRATLDLPAGASTIVIRDLPFALDPDSLRVAGEANGRVTIGAVETRVTPAEARGSDTAIVTRLRQLRDARDAAQVSLDALAAQQAMMLRYAQAGPEKIAGEPRPLPLGEWTAAFETIGRALTRTGEELRVARAKAKELDEEIHALDSGQNGRAPRRPAREAVVFVEAASGGPARLTLSYLVAGASWRPLYEARLETNGAAGKPRLELTRRAAVTQTTGEDWSDVALGVSTTRAHRGASAPETQPQRVAFQEPPQYVAKALAPTPRALRESSLDAAPPSAPVEQQSAALESGAFAATFEISGRVGVPSDGATKSFVLSARGVEPALSIRVAPALDPTAYLEARVVNDEDAPLLPGVVLVQRDGVHVGTSHIGFVAPGEAVELGFGADDKIKVARAPVKRVENEPSWFGQTRFETRDFKTTLQNLHDFALPVTVVDQIPFSETTAITVETLPQTTPPSVKQLGDKRGVFAWTFDARPRETKELRLAYRVKWPAEREIVIQPAPLAPR